MMDLRVNLDAYCEAWIWYIIEGWGSFVEHGSEMKYLEFKVTCRPFFLSEVFSTHWFRTQNREPPTNDKNKTTSFHQDGRWTYLLCLLNLATVQGIFAKMPSEAGSRRKFAFPIKLHTVTWSLALAAKQWQTLLHLEISRLWLLVFGSHWINC